jgi:hypothetical protein
MMFPVVTANKECSLVNLSDVAQITTKREAASGRTILVYGTEDGEYLQETHIDALFEYFMFLNPLLVKCDRGSLINIKKVINYNSNLKTVSLTGGYIAPVACGKVKDVEQRLYG